MVCVVMLHAEVEEEVSGIFIGSEQFADQQMSVVEQAECQSFQQISVACGPKHSPAHLPDAQDHTEIPICGLSTERQGAELFIKIVENLFRVSFA